MPIRPGINHFSIPASSVPVCSQTLAQLEKKMISRMKMAVMDILISREAEAMTVFAEALSEFQSEHEELLDAQFYFQYGVAAAMERNPAVVERHRTSLAPFIDSQ